MGVVCNRPTTNWARGWQCAAAPSAHVAAPTIMPPKGSSAARQSAGKKSYELKKVLEVSEQCVSVLSVSTLPRPCHLSCGWLLDSCRLVPFRVADVTIRMNPALLAGANAQCTSPATAHGGWVCQ